MAEERCIRCADRVPWLALAGNLSLTVYKVAVGFLGGSSALIADGLHSGTDVVGTGMIIISRKVSSEPADDEHPYGHGKVEFMGSAFIYILLLILAIVIIGGAVAVMLSGEVQRPQTVTLLAAGVSVICNLLMYWLGTCAGNKVKSPALLANAFENRADAISSTAVVIGIGAATVIHPLCDPIAALAVGLIIGYNAVSELRKSFAGLMDTALPIEVVERIEQLASAEEGVIAVDYVKSRGVGHGAWVDVGIRVRGDVDVGEADDIAKRVRSEILCRLDDVVRVEVFVKSEAARRGRDKSRP